MKKLGLSCAKLSTRFAYLGQMSQLKLHCLLSVRLPSCEVVFLRACLPSGLRFKV